jgi:hypothetical protein
MTIVRVMPAARGTIDKIGILLGIIFWWWGVNWWSQIFGLLVIAYVASDLFWQARWARKIPAAIKIVVCLYFIYGILLTRLANENASRPAAFRIVVPVMMHDWTMDVIGGIMASYPGEHGKMASPINLALYVRLTNLKQIPVMIERYSVAIGATQNGPWEVLIPLSFTRIYLLQPQQDLTRVRPYNIKTLNNALYEFSIPPGAVVTGWALFVISEKPTKPNFLRFQILDSTGESSFHSVPFPTETAPSEVSVHKGGLGKSYLCPPIHRLAEVLHFPPSFF